MKIGVKAFIVTLFLCIVIPVAQAETPFEFTQCVTGPTTVLSSSEELTILSAELKGIIMSNHENKIFDNFISHFLGVSRIMAGQVDARGYSKLTDFDGDFILTETTTFVPVGKATWKRKSLQGTGEWKGITGSTTVLPLTKRASVVKGTWRGCYEVTGTFELPK